jgi:DNA-binding MarR family transcriptional regulator
VDRLVEAELVERRPAEDDRRRIVLSLTAKGRRTEKKVARAREQAIEAGRLLVGERDLEPALELMRDLIQFSPHAELVARRRELLDRERAAAR